MEYNVFWRSYLVCSEIHEQKGEHGQVLRCYLLDSVRKQEVFGYLERSEHKLELQPFVLENIDVSWRKEGRNYPKSAVRRFFKVRKCT